MNKKAVRGSAVLLNIITVILVGVLLFVLWYPRHEQRKLTKNFNAAIQAAEKLYDLSKTFYIEHNRWPSAMSELKNSLDAKPVSAWEIANKVYSCELAYGRGDQSRNEIKCSPIGKYASVLSYQIVLSDANLHKRYCQAVKTNPKANEMCKKVGGVFSHNKAGGVVSSIYVVQR